MATTKQRLNEISDISAKSLCVISRLLWTAPVKSNDQLDPATAHHLSDIRAGDRLLRYSTIFRMTSSSSSLSARLACPWSSGNAGAGRLKSPQVVFPPRPSLSRRIYFISDASRATLQIKNPRPRPSPILVDVHGWFGSLKAPDKSTSVTLHFTWRPTAVSSMPSVLCVSTSVMRSTRTMSWAIYTSLFTVNGSITVKKWKKIHKRLRVAYLPSIATWHESRPMTVFSLICSLITPAFSTSAIWCHVFHSRFFCLLYIFYVLPFGV